VDPRTRLMIQQQRGAVSTVQGYSAHIVQRMSGPRNPLDPYDHLVQQRQQLGFPQGKLQCQCIVPVPVPVPVRGMVSDSALGTRHGLRVFLVQLSYCQVCESQLTHLPAIYRGTVFLHRQFCDSRSANTKCNSSCHSASGEAVHNSGRGTCESDGSSDEANQGYIPTRAFSGSSCM
jgi:hypothetical protein